MRLLNVVPVTVAVAPVYWTVLVVIVNVLVPLSVNAVPVPVNTKVSPAISRFWLVSTVMDVAVKLDELDRVEFPVLAETWRIPRSTFVALLSVTV